MKKTFSALSLGLVVILITAAGCSKTEEATAPAPQAIPDVAKPATAAAVAPAAKSDLATFQGSWKGREDGTPGPDAATLVFTGTNLVFHNADTNEWYKASFTLHEDKDPKQLVAIITDCPFPDYKGKSVNSIYKLENGALTMAAYEPGNPDSPKTFNDPNNRAFIFKLDK